MMYLLRKILFIVQWMRFLPIRFLLDYKNDQFSKDIVRWSKIHQIHTSRPNEVALLLYRYREFRNLVLYRHRFHPVKRLWIKIWYSPMDTLFIEAKEIGGGCFIQHGFSTMITAEYIGENVWINQQVTLGYNGHSRSPIIGDNVTITCGAKVLGPITIGNHVVVGANAVVIRDVPDHCVVAGVPAKIIKDGRKQNE